MLIALSMMPGLSETARRLQQLVSWLVADPAEWDARCLSAADIAAIHPLDDEQHQSFELPSVRKTADEGLRAHIRDQYNNLPIDDTLFAVDMEILHIKEKMGK